MSETPTPRTDAAGMGDSCDDLARIIEEYVERTANTTAHVRDRSEAEGT